MSKIFRFLLLAGFAAVAGLIVGAVSGLWSFGAFGGDGWDGQAYKFNAKGWSGDLAIGSRDAGPYTRARIAKRGLLALSRDETIYFFRDRDDAGDRLVETCRYRLTGGAMPARWWSVTLYAEDDFLALNDDNAHSVSPEKISDGADWQAVIQPSRPENGAWISSKEAGPFNLTLRLYNPSDAALERPEDIPFPDLTKIYCQESQS
ncbi:DUF1214 domain-containing protein [Hyphococcus luteus]|nr:DUF1214 domain-containing protein [Marinicaulis flavus]